jgi:hypothetical protein
VNNLRKIKVLPQLSNKAIERAVEQFIEDSRVENVDKIGMYNQTIESIAQATIFATNNVNQFWLADDGQDVLAYALAHVSKDIDNQLTYTISQAWVCPNLRTKKIVKVWFQQLQDEAARLMCKHIMLPASRHVKPYLRFLGKGYHVYATLIKKDL